MRPFVLLLIVVPAILHAYPQRQTDRRRTDVVEAGVTSRGSSKYNPRDGPLLEEDPGAWRPERTERRQPSRQLPQQRDRSTPSSKGPSSDVVPPTASSRRRAGNRRAHTHVAEPETASSVLTSVAHQLVSSRRTFQEQHSTPEEVTLRSESPRRRLGITLNARHIPADKNFGQNENKTQNSSHSSEDTSTEFSRRSRNGRRHSAPSTETPKRSGRRGASTGGRREQNPLSSGITPATVQHSTSVQSVRTETSSSSPLTEGSSTVKIPDETETPLEISNATVGITTQLEVKQDLPVTDVPESVSIKTGELLEIRRKDASGRSGRKIDSSQTSVSGKRNRYNNTIFDSVSFPSTQQPRRRPSNYIDVLPKVRNSTLASSHDLPAEIPGRGFTRRTTTTDFPPKEWERQSTSVSVKRKNVADVDTPVNGPRSRGQPRNRAKDSAETERSVEARHQRTHHRNPITTGGSRFGLSDDAVPSSKPPTTARNLGGQTSSRNRNVTQTPLNSRDGSRRSHFRRDEFKLHKPVSSSESSENTPQSHSSAEEEIKKLQKQETLKHLRDSEEQEARADLEDSFITRSSHRVVSVTAYPYNEDQLAPTPPPSKTENNVQHRQMQVVGSYNHLRDSKFSSTRSDDSNNSEGHSVVTTVPRLTRYSSRKCYADSDENHVNKLSSTASRGKPCDEKYQKETPALPTAEMHQRVPTSSSAVSAPNQTVSHTGRSEFKHRLTYVSEKMSPSSVSSTMKPRPPSLFLPTVRKSPDSRVTTFNTGIGGTTQKKPVPRSTSSFRRSVELAMGDNWIAPTTNSVSAVTSQSALASIPRFSSRYRSELLRATGHGLRGTTAPVYVPTVPTVSTTSTTGQTMFSDTPPDALNLLDVTESRTPSSWTHTITSQSISHTLSPNKSSAHISSSHNTKQGLESKTSVSSSKSSVLSVSVQQSITGGAITKHSDSSSKFTTQQPNPLTNNSPSLDRWKLQTDVKNFEMNSALSTKDLPNRDIPTAKDTIKNTGTKDSDGVPSKPKAISKPRHNLLTNSSKITLKETQNIPRESFPVTTPSNLKINVTTILNQSAATKFTLKPNKIITLSAAVTSVPTKENPPDTQKYSDFTTEVALIVDQKPKTTIQSQKKNLGNNLLLPNFHDIIILSTTKSPPMKTTKTVIPDPAVTENMPMQFAVKSTALPKGTVGSTTSRVVRVRDVKSSLQPAASTVSTITDRTIPQSRVQARAATEVPINFTTTDLPLTTTDLIVNDILTPDLPTTTFETLNLQTTTLSTTDAPSMTELSFDLPTTTELPTIAPRTAISTTTTPPAISTIPTTIIPATTTIPTTTTFAAVSTIPTTVVPATTTTATTAASITIPTTTIIPVTQTMPISTTTPTTTASPTTTHPQVTTINIMTLQDADSNVQQLSVTQTTTVAAPRVFTTTLRTPAPYVIFGIYPNGTVFRKLPNSNFKEQVHENEIARRNPFYPDQRYFSTTPSAPAQSVYSNEIALQAPSFDDGFNDARNQIQDEDAQVLQLPTIMTTRPEQPPAPTEAPAQTSGFALGNLISNALGIDSQSGSLPSTRAKFLAEIVRNSNIITARSNPIMTATATTTTTTTTTAKTTKTPAPMPALPTSTAAAPKTTANPAAGVLDDFSFLNVLLLGRPPDDSSRPGRNQGSSIANRIIQVALERGNSSRKKPSATTPKVTTPKMTTPNTVTQKPTTPKATTPKASTSAPQQPSVEQNQEDLAALLKLLGNMESTTPGNLTPSQQLLADFLIKQATSRPSERNLNNQISIQDVLNPPAMSKTSKKLRSSPTTEAAPGQLLGELFGPLVGGNQGDTKIRDPRAGQGLVEAAIKATKSVSQLMGSVLQGATKSLQSFMKSLAWGSGGGSG